MGQPDPPTIPDMPTPPPEVAAFVDAFSALQRAGHIDTTAIPDGFVLWLDSTRTPSDPDWETVSCHVMHRSGPRVSAGCTYRVPVTVHGPRPAVIDLEIVVDDDAATSRGSDVDTGT